MQKKDLKKINYLNNYEITKENLVTVSKLEKGNFAGIEGLNEDDIYNQSLKVLKFFFIIAYLVIWNFIFY